MRNAVLFCLALLVPGVCFADVDNPEFQSWSKFGVGSMVEYKVQSEAAGTKTESTMTVTLVEKTDDKVVLETKTTMVVAGNEMTMPAQKRDVPAKLKEQEGQAGENEAQEGKDEVEAAGKTLSCKTTQSVTESNGMKTTSKVWTCDDVPGGMVKMESKTEGSVSSNTEMNLVKLETK
ncbi:MAG: hypothetical protein R3F62_03065 [Planctomycetota bacterium]